MPKFLVPHKSGAHRVAAIALYRALLAQCKALTLEAPREDELQNIVRNRFKEARHVTSHRQLRVCFEAGYEAIDHLDDAVAGDEGKKEFVLDMLDKVPERVKKAPKPAGKPMSRKEFAVCKKKLEQAKDKQEGREPPPKISLFGCPLPLAQLSGKRHVPVLYNANHIPVLRLKKPQPKSLSGYINSRIVQRQKRHDRRHRLGEELQLARSEDVWDSIVVQYTGVDSRKTEKEGGGMIKEPLWKTEVADALVVVSEALAKERETNRVVAEVMQGVVDRERELAEREKSARNEPKKPKGSRQVEAKEVIEEEREQEKKMHAPKRRHGQADYASSGDLVRGAIEG